MFGRRKIKELEALCKSLKRLYGEEVKRSCRYQWKYERLEAEKLSHLFVCKDCGKCFSTPSFKETPINQHEKQFVAFCPKCGSRHITMEKVL